MALSGTHTSGEVGHVADHNLIDAKLTAHDTTLGALGVWATYVPTLTSMTLGNGTVSARWGQVGKTVRLHVIITLGSTSTVAGPNIGVSLPVSSVATAMGSAMLTDSGNTIYSAMIYASASTATVWALAAGSHAVATISAAVPFTWSTGDIVNLDVTYETP